MVGSHERWTPGSSIFAQGDPGESLFVVREGTVDLRDADRVRRDA